MDQNPSPPEYSAAKPPGVDPGNPIGSPAKQAFNGRALLKKYALWFLRLPAFIVFEAWRYLGIAVLKARMQMTKRMNLKWAYETLGRAAYEKQITPDTFSAQYVEIKEAEGKLAEKRQPATSGENPTFKTKAAQKFKNLVSWIQSLPLARRLNRLLVSLGKTISADETVGGQFFNEWTNLTTVQTRMAALKARCKATAEHIPSQTAFSWWPQTITGILIVLALISIPLWKPENRLYRLALAFFLISGSRYLWFSLTVPKEERPKLKWWASPGAISGLVCLVLIPYATSIPVAQLSQNVENGMRDQNTSSDKGAITNVKKATQQYAKFQEGIDFEKPDTVLPGPTIIHDEYEEQQKGNTAFSASRMNWSEFVKHLDHKGYHSGNNHANPETFWFAASAERSCTVIASGNKEAVSRVEIAMVFVDDLDDYKRAMDNVIDIACLLCQPSAESKLRKWYSQCFVAALDLYGENPKGPRLISGAAHYGRVRFRFFMTAQHQVIVIISPLRP